MQGEFKSIQKAPSKDGNVWIWHVDNVEGDVFGVGIFGSAEGYRECDSIDRFDSFAAEAIEGLRRFSELPLVETHFVEGC
jgi:hypothetical protein